VKLIDPAHPFFRPAWRRWATAAVPAAWGLVELTTGEPFWAILFLAAGAYAFWVLVLSWKPPAE
jgi:hypothetical protein